MKKREQKGFTIVELVIVIAVIAVLATVLVPTFGDLIGRAQAAAATQQVANAYKEALVKALADDGIITEDEEVTVGQFIFTFKEGGQGAQIRTEDFPYPQVCIVDGKVQLGPKNEAGETTEATKEQEHQPDVQPEPTIMVESITLEQPEPSLNVGEERRLSYTIAPAEAAETKQIVWASSDTSVAIVENGKVTAKGVGKAIITASVDQHTASCEVDVTFEKKASGKEDITKILSSENIGERSVSLTDSLKYSTNITITAAMGSVTIDLHGFSLENTGKITVNDGAELNILNGNFITSKEIIIKTGGKMTVCNTAMTTSNTVTVQDGGELSISGGTTTINQVLTVSSGATMTISNCTLKANAYIKVDGMANNLGRLAITDSAIYSTDASKGFDIIGYAEITDTTIHYTGGNCALNVGYSGSPGIARLTLNKTDVISNGTVIQADYESTVNIIGGTLSCESGKQALVISDFDSKVYFHMDGGEPVTIIADHAYTQKQNYITEEYCFVGEGNVKIQAPA